MSSVYHDGICINYTNKEIKDKKLLLNALINDPCLIKRIIPKSIDLHKSTKLSNYHDDDSDDSVYIEDVYAYLKERITPYFDAIHDSIDKKGRDKVLFDLYNSLLLFKYDEKEYFKNPYSSEDYVYSCIGLLYSDSVDSYLELIAKPFESVHDELFAVVNNEYRDKAFNYYLRFLRDELNYHDERLLDTINFILSNNNYTYQDSSFDVSKKSYVDLDNLNSMVEDILKRIDPSCLWLELYKKGLSDKTIKYLDSTDEKTTHSRVYDGVMYVACDHSINDVVVSIHEFCHYVSKKCGYEKFSLREFPSVLFEEYTFNYLIDKGFSIDEVNYYKCKRENFFYRKYNDYMPYYQLMLLQEKLPDKEIGDFHTVFYNNVKDTGKLINHYLSCIISNPNSILRSASYLVADYFRGVYSKINGDNLEDMVLTTERLADYDISKLVSKLGKDKVLKNTLGSKK